jgi:major intracellular serine protease
MKNDDVKLIPNNVVTINEVEDVIPNNIKNVGAQEQWDYGNTGKGIVIAMLDTGCDVNHPDLSNRIIGGYNFTNEHDGDVTNYNDTNGHGTHASGIVAASKNGQGVVGVAPDAMLLILKVLNKFGSGTINNLITAINYAIDWRGNQGEKVRVISLSLGTKNPSEDLYQAIKRAIVNEIAIVVASGNDGDGSLGTNEYRYPGAFEEVIEVGAVDENNTIAYFSNTNEFVDLYAPGVNINSCYKDQKFAVLSGTSMAVPHVTGAIALLFEKYEKQYKRSISEEEVYQKLMEHTRLVVVDSNHDIKVLSLSKSVEREEENSQIKNREMLLKCFCEARKTQAYFTKCLDEESSKEEREFILELVQESAKTSNKIKEFCEKECLEMI